MPMPHRIQAQLIKKRLAGKEGQARVNELRVILAELPGYKNGPYADLRKWVEGELVKTRARSRTLNRDSISFRREGAAQVAVAGPPNVGKSSLLQALSEIEIRTGDFAFTTLRPVPAVTAHPGRSHPACRDPGPDRGRPPGPRRRTRLARCFEGCRRHPSLSHGRGRPGCAIHSSIRAGCGRHRPAHGPGRHEARRSPGWIGRNAGRGRPRHPDRPGVGPRRRLAGSCARTLSGLSPV